MEIAWVHAQVDFGYFGPPEEHLLWTEEEREATYITAEDPSSEIAGEVAAAFAATAIAFNETGMYAPAPSIQQSFAAWHVAMTPAVDGVGATQSGMRCQSDQFFPAGPSDALLCGADPDYSKRLIKHATQMLDFGLDHPGSYMLSKQDGLRDHGKHYPSSNYNDEMAWGALWLYKATGVRNIPSLLLSSPSCIAFLNLQQCHDQQQTALQACLQSCVMCCAPS